MWKVNKQLNALQQSAQKASTRIGSGLWRIAEFLITRQEMITKQAVPADVYDGKHLHYPCSFSNLYSTVGWFFSSLSSACYILFDDLAHLLLAPRAESSTSFQKTNIITFILPFVLGRTHQDFFVVRQSPYRLIRISGDTVETDSAPPTLTKTFSRSWTALPYVAVVQGSHQLSRESHCQEGFSPIPTHQSSGVKYNWSTVFGQKNSSASVRRNYRKIWSYKKPSISSHSIKAQNLKRRLNSIGIFLLEGNPARTREKNAKKRKNPKENKDAYSWWSSGSERYLIQSGIKDSSFSCGT